MANIKQKTLYCIGNGLSVTFRKRAFDKYTKIVMIDLLPDNAREWSMAQGEDSIWFKTYHKFNTLKKFRKKLAKLYRAEPIVHEEKNMLEFKLKNNRILEYYYNTDAKDFPYVVSTETGVLFERTNYILTDDEFLDEMLEICEFCTAYFVKCNCQDGEYCPENKTANALIEEFNERARDAGTHNPRIVLYK